MTTAALLALITLFGQTAAPKPETAPKMPKVQVLDLSGELIEGATDAPLETLVETRRGPAFGSLLKLRENFDDKRLASVHEM
jgi:hypothetical protein